VAGLGPLRPSALLVVVAAGHTRRVCIDLYRRDRRAPDLTETGDAPDGRAPDDVEVSAERSWAAWEVRRAVESLRPEEREVIRLAHFHGLSLPEVAQLLDIPVGTVKSRSNRAYRHLAQVLDHARRSAA
jgi:RNA polymerase sigma-70 factor (ECF subfamily)